MLTEISLLPTRNIENRQSPREQRILSFAFLKTRFSIRILSSVFHRVSSRTFSSAISYVLSVTPQASFAVQRKEELYPVKLKHSVVFYINLFHTKLNSVRNFTFGFILKISLIKISLVAASIFLYKEKYALNKYLQIVIAYCVSSRQMVCKLFQYHRNKVIAYC